MADAMLPLDFADLEPFAETWCLPTEGERYAQRLASSMTELQAFYDAVFPHVDDSDRILRPVPARRDAGRRSSVAPDRALVRHGVVPGRGVAAARTGQRRHRAHRPTQRALSLSAGPFRPPPNVRAAHAGELKVVGGRGSFRTGQRPRRSTFKGCGHAWMPLTTAITSTGRTVRCVDGPQRRTANAQATAERNDRNSRATSGPVGV